MGRILKVLLILCSLAFTCTLAAVDKPQIESIDIDGTESVLTLESFRPLKSPLDDLVAKQEDPTIKIHQRKTAVRLGNALPEYFGAFPGMVIGFATLALGPSYERLYLNVSKNGFATRE